ncbi:MAG: sigma-70 family RNA polymerase sigma factor [Saprospiraceae bacterium]
MSSIPNAESFLAMIETNKGIIYKVANSYCRNEENKKDLIQEIILQLWLSWDKYDTAFKISTWMYRIALNVSISFYRKEHRRNQITHPLPDNILLLQENQQQGHLSYDVEMLHRSIRELREMDRALIILHLEGNSHQEISDILGLTTTNVSTKILRIKQELKQKLSHLQSKK